MNETNIFSHGCDWVRTDFHLHTRKDKEFVFSGDDNQFIALYVEKMKQEDIRLGVITNHNKFDLDEFKALRKVAIKQQIYLLPGVELSVNDGKNGVHTLIVFHEEWIDNTENVDFIDRFLKLTFVDRPNYETDNNRTHHNITQTFEILEGYGKDYFVIFAHVEQKNGLWEELNGGRLQELGRTKAFQQRTLGFQKVRTHQKRLYHQDCFKEHYPAEVEGSDPKNIDEIGKGEKTYIKIGDFSFDAVKYALTNYSQRVLTEIPKVCHSYIRSIQFVGGFFDGQEITFHSGLNCLIGIRGSGKSAVLEAIRYALDIPFGLQAQDKKYKEGLIEYVLGSGGKIIIKVISQKQEEFEIHRILNKSPDIFLKGNRVDINLDTVIHSPIYFGQKDLASTGDGFEKDLVEKLVGKKLENIRQQIDKQKSVVLDHIQRLEKLKNLDEQEAEWKKRKRDAEFQLEFFKKHGVEEKLKRQVEFNKDIEQCNQILRITTNLIQSGNQFIEEQEKVLIQYRGYESTENKVFFESIYKTYDLIIKSIVDFKAPFIKNEKYYRQLNSQQGELISKRDELKEEFASVLRELNQQIQKESGIKTIQLDDFIELNKTISTSERVLTELEASRNTRERIRRDLFTSLQKIESLWSQEYDQILLELTKINDAQTSLQINIEFQTDKEEMLKYLQSIFKGTGIRTSTYESIADQFQNFITLYEKLNNESLEQLLGNNFVKFNECFYQNLSALLTWQTPNRYTIRYYEKELKHHSLGQRASALILFILSQKNHDVIMIDQPEDDLDNQTIYKDVIKDIGTLKQKMQFIFATHNANFPVLGDAERVVACSFEDERIQAHIGNIDDQTTQDSIVKIMEGGKDAFAKRKEIYSLWKQ